MSFLSFEFGIFLLLAVAIYYRVPARAQWLVLLAANMAFYAFAGIKAFGFILYTIILTWIIGNYFGGVNAKQDRRLEELPQEDKEERMVLRSFYRRRKRVYLILAIVANYLILVFLKFHWLSDGVMRLMAQLFGSFGRGNISIVIPLGISYYTFTAVGYLIDVYRGKYKPERNLLRYMLFVSFFPALVEGPINRFDVLGEKLYSPHRFDYQLVKSGGVLMLYGYFKKLVLADRMLIILNTIMGDTVKYQGTYILVAMFMSWMWLYMDFSGGVDIARGAAQLFGIAMAENFERPFFSKTVGEFWRRWHMSLNEWWRDYIFYPLTKSRLMKGIGKKCRGMMGVELGKKMPVFLVLIFIRIINSFWHGISMENLLGGLYHGFTVGFAFMLEPVLIKMDCRLKIRTGCFSWRFFQMMRTYFLLSIPRVMFNAASWENVRQNVRGLFVYNPWILFDGSLYSLGVNKEQWHVVIMGLMVVLLISACKERGISICDSLARQNLWFRWSVYLMGVFSIVLFGTYGPGYDAASFRYANF